VTGTQGVSVQRVAFRHAWGDAVALSPGGSWDAQGNGAVLPSDVTVADSSVDTTGRMAFGCTGCRRFTVRDTTVTNVGYHVVDVEVEAPAWSGDVTLDRVTYSNTYLALVSATTGDGDVAGVTVRDSRRTDEPVTCEPAVQVGQAGHTYGPTTVTGSTLRAYGDVVSIRAGSSATVTGNDLTAGGGGCGTRIGVQASTAGGLVSGNTLVNSTGIVADPAVVVCGNTIDGTPDRPC
jgi:hypothetical protein